METNEIMTNEEEILDLETEEETEDTENRSGLGTIVLGSIIGSGLTLAAIAGGKKLKKVFANVKAKRDAAKAAKAESESNENDDAESEE